MPAPRLSALPSRAAVSVLVASATLLAAADARAACSLCPIDDFEAGGFSLLGPTLGWGYVSIPGYASHAIAPLRGIRLDSTGDGATLIPGTSIDDYVAVTVSHSSSASLRWDWSLPTDLTSGGTVDCIDLVVSGSAGQQIDLVIGDGGGGSATQPRFLVGTDGPETVTWSLASFPTDSVDVTWANSIQLSFSDPSSGTTTYQAYDLRFGKAGTGAADFQGLFIATQTPPVPTPPLRFNVLDAITSQSLWEARVSIANALTDAQTVPPMDWTWSQTQIPGYDVAEMTLQWNDPDVVETDFDVSIDAAVPGGLSGQIDAYPPDPAYTAESIALYFPVMTFDALGTPTGSSNTWLTFNFDDQQLGSLEFQGVTVTENVLGPSLTDGFTLHFRMAYSGMNTPDYQFPLFHATWISDWTAQTATAAVAEVPVGREPLRLTAAPSVTRAETEIRSSRPFERATRVLVHDVTGRLVRSLPAVPGASAVRWDGRTGDGLSAAAGVYFVRLADGSAVATRVVKVATR